jgi:hypothetical protein
MSRERLGIESSRPTAPFCLVIGAARHALSEGFASRPNCCAGWFTPRFTPHGLDRRWERIQDHRTFVAPFLLKFADQAANGGR